jgi:hypothetical protein
MQAVAGAAPELAGAAARRAEAALASRQGAEPLDATAARAEFARMMEGAAGAQAVAS